jgi:hypothetical protein
MKRTKRLTKRERKALDPHRPAAPTNDHEHIHCVACGRHISPDEFSTTPAMSTFVECDHGTRFPSCASCLLESEKRISTHDRTGQPVVKAPAWH